MRELPLPKQPLLQFIRIEIYTLVLNINKLKLSTLMKRRIVPRYLALLLLIAASSIVHSQTVTRSRTAELIRGGYAITGSAFLEELDNGEIQLRLSDDYTTPSGPDVRVYLANHPTNTSDALLIENIADSGHFSGAKTWVIDAPLTLDTYDYIIFRCVAFGLHWAGGNFGAPANGGGNNGGGEIDNCVATSVATTDWVASVDICPIDGQADEIALRNTENISAGNRYAYVLTDIDRNIQIVHFENTYNFEGSGSTPIRVYGVSYEGTLSYEAGQPLDSITSDGCIEFSNPDVYLTVTKNGCTNAPLCVETNVATTAWVSEVSICPSDGESDNVPFLNHLFIDAGEVYAYVITDEDRKVKEVVMQDSYDFEGSGDATDYVYGISYSGQLSYSIGDDLSSITASSCIQVSSSELFLTIKKDACVAPMCEASNVATSNWVTDISVCPNDGQSNNIPLQNSLLVPAGDNYAYVFTDENQRIKFLHFEDSYDFEGSGLGTDYVYGVSYVGNLSYEVGDPLSSITSDDCVTVSSDELFLTVKKDACVSNTGSISGTVTNYKGDGVKDVVITLNTGATQTTKSDGSYAFTDLPLNMPYTLTPSKEGNLLNGVSAQDMVIISRHILGLKEFESPYLNIAADANKDKKVSAIDIINYINLIIGKTSELSNGANWRFVPGDQTFDGNDPYEFVEKDAVQNLDGDVTDMHFIAVKLGDVSGNASTQ